jgi:hypothetical protein
MPFSSLYTWWMFSKYEGMYMYLGTYRDARVWVVTDGDLRREMKGSGIRAVAVGDNIVLRAKHLRKDTGVMRHEYQHVVQHRKDRLFILKYLLHLALRGYRENPFEQEARSVEKISS